MTSLTIITLTLIAICCFLAAKYHNADKLAALSEKSLLYASPVTLENATEILKSKGFNIIGVDNENKRITFEINGNKLVLDIERNPVTFLYLGFSMDDDMDKECLARAAFQTTRDIISVKVSMEEDGYSFLISSCECCIGNLNESLDRYLDIMNDACAKLHEYYHQYVDEKKGDGHEADALPPDNQQYETIGSNKASMLS